MTATVRLNAGNTRYSLLPQPLIDAEAELYTAGARKYSAWGWLETPMDEEETLDSAMRHLKKWRSGQTFDPETGAHHLTATRWNLGVLFMYEFKGVTRPGRKVFKPSAEFEMAQEDANQLAAEFVSVSVPTPFSGLYHSDVGPKASVLGLEI